MIISRRRFIRGSCETLAGLTLADGLVAHGASGLSSNKIASVVPDCSKKQGTVYEVWEPDPAPNKGANWQRGAGGGGRPRDDDWERWSYPIGNGYMGANVFGRFDTERIQLTEKTLFNRGVWGGGGLTNFAEIYLDFNHSEVERYRRSLNLNEAIMHVSYREDGVGYRREYFMSYPDNVMAVKVSASKKGEVSFVLRPEIPYLDEDEQRTGKIMVQDDLITLSGSISFFNVNYEAQIKVIAEGGSVKGDPENGRISISNADSVVILVTAGTNYRLSEQIFRRSPDRKLDPDEFPRDEVSSRLESAQQMGYDELRKRHLKDYGELFDRVKINLNSSISEDPTSVLLDKYKKGEKNPWLEELLFQYGRYLLIASSREKTLPSGLQGVWSQYYITPWTGGYWHNINVQMNYWGAMSANLAECFEAYIEYFKAYLPRARRAARDYINNHHPSRLAKDDGDNGWVLGTGASPYGIRGPGGHSGPGTGGFTSKLLMEYYLYTKDQGFLKEIAYPAMRSLSTFYSKTLVPKGELLLVYPSASPEQRKDGKYYTTTGTTFDQGFVWENFNDYLTLAETLGKEDDFTERIRDEITKLDPIKIGASGQIKEFREEENYSDIGQANHRHISHLCPLYPGTLITSENEEWMRAASTTLDLRGDRTTGWGMAHRMNCRARLKEGENARSIYTQFIQGRAMPNLWTLHPPFQIDGNFGTMAGVAEMLLQSHEGCIEVLPALPQAWHTGSFSGLVARGNFAVSADWQDGRNVRMEIVSRSGGECRIRAPRAEF